MSVGVTDGHAADHVISRCAALGDGTRWRVLEGVGTQARSASDLTDLVPVSRQAIAKHLAVLEAVGLVERVTVGREVRFQALGSGLSGLAADLDAVGREWERRLDRLARLAEETHRRAPREE